MVAFALVTVDNRMIKLKKARRYQEAFTLLIKTIVPPLY